MLEKHRATAEERAFPVPVGVVVADMQGMSLRDYFAAIALRSCLKQYTLCAASKQAYYIADAMMEARKTVG